MKRTAKSTILVFLQFKSTKRRILTCLPTSFVLIILIGLVHIVFAEDSNSERLISRPVIEYSSGDLRDPFADLFQLAIKKEQKEKDEQNIQVLEESIDPEKSMLDLGKFKVQGVIWGGNFPQVIINNKILGIGDLIDKAEIVSIETKGITLNLAGRMVNLPTPGNAPVLKKMDKGEK